MVGALLESTHTWHGQHLFMNGLTITHPPTATADRGRGDTASHQKQKKNEAVTPGGGEEEYNKVATINIFYGLFFLFLVPDGSS